MNNEPVWTVTGFVAVITALVAMLVSFGLPLTPEQTNAILLFLTVLAPTLVALFARPKVTSNSQVVAVKSDAGPVAFDASPLPNDTRVAIVPLADLAENGR